MKVTLWVRLALWFRRTKKRMRNMNAPDIVKSKTTQNQLAASGGVAGMLIAAVTFLRATFPALVPWPSELDIQVITLVTALLAIVPLISRKVSMWRDPEKVDRRKTIERLADIIADLPEEAVAGAIQSTTEIARVAFKKDRPPRETSEERKANFDVFATRIHAAAEAVRKKKAEAARAAKQ
jgi:hypothetical protein